ncbi:MAG: glycoside hydrolase family 3 C-terminal domain-containing protein [Rikenellaceae bacterium]|nr:glycoside hydrolase family 3 C-terminal domain-containing protein [Rikenellaceae bacterium]
MQRIICLVIIITFFCGRLAAQPVYKDSGAPLEERVSDLLRRMTLEEKIMQLNQWTYGRNDNVNNHEKAERQVDPTIGSVIYRSTSPALRNELQRRAMEETRLGIPILFGFDVIHGYRTIFPIPLAQSCAWDAELVREGCRVAATEAYLTGIDWTFSPMVDVARDARWGRVAEGYGEDPYLNAVLGTAAVEGYQGDDLSQPYNIAACLKHYVGYSLSEGGRDYHYTDISGQTLWETMLPPFEAGVAAGAATVMSSFNDISGIPGSANRYTLTEILKEHWGFDGFVVSDWGSVEQLVNQGVAADRREAAMKAFMAGVEMDMVDNAYKDHLGELVSEGLVPVGNIDEAVRRILRVKFRLGLFDDPYTPELPEEDRYLLPEFRRAAERAAAESMVLLKNERSVLPLTDPAARIALIGPMADERVHLMGSWEGKGLADDVRSILDGMLSEFGPDRIMTARGCGFDGDDTSGFDEAVRIAAGADVAVLCLGEMEHWSGENGTRSTLALPDVQERLAAEIHRTGTPVVLLLSSGRPVELARLESLADAILVVWQPGTCGGVAVAGILSGRTNPSGKLSITFPLHTGQIPIYYNMRNPARHNQGLYQDIPSAPLYEFGHGLSYTTFEYGEIFLPETVFSRNETITAEIEVRNTGARDGKEAVLWFVTDPVASISRPAKELKHFEKQDIPAGESRTYRFEIVPERDLSFVDARGGRHLENGEFILTVGNRKIKFELTD